MITFHNAHERPVSGDTVGAPDAAVPVTLRNRRPLLQIRDVGTNLSAKIMATDEYAEAEAHGFEQEPAYDLGDVHQLGIREGCQQRRDHIAMRPGPASPVALPGMTRGPSVDFKETAQY